MTARFQHLPGAGNVGFEGRQRRPVGDADYRLGSEVEDGIDLVFVDGSLDHARRIDTAVHQLDAVHYAERLEKATATRITKHADNGRAAREQARRQPTAHKPADTGHQDRPVLPSVAAVVGHPISTLLYPRSRMGWSERGS